MRVCSYHVGKFLMCTVPNTDIYKLISRLTTYSSSTRAHTRHPHPHPHPHIHAAHTPTHATHTHAHTHPCTPYPFKYAHTHTHTNTNTHAAKPPSPLNLLYKLSLSGQGCSFEIAYTAMFFWHMGTKHPGWLQKHETEELEKDHQ